MSPPPLRPEPYVIGSAESAAPCALHAGNVGGQICERCGDFMCVLCATPTEGRIYCPRCFDLLHERGALMLAQQDFTTPRTSLRMAVWAVPALLLYGVGLIMAGVALAGGISALRQISRRPELPGKQQAQGAVVVASIALLLGFGFIFWALSRLFP